MLTPQRTFSVADALLAAAATFATLAPAGAWAQRDVYTPPLYWTAYEYHIVRQQQEGTALGSDSGSSGGDGDTSENYIPETELMANVDWVGANLLPYGYDMIAIDGWGDSLVLNEHGYRASHSQRWEHDYAWWSEHLQSRGMRLGMYENPLFVHVPPEDTETTIVGTNIPVSSLIDPAEDSTFNWVQVDRPGAEEYIKGHIAYYAGLGIEYMRLDFLSWYEDGQDRYLGRVGPDRPREHYATALRWMHEAALEHGMYLSLAMVHLYNEAEIERQYAHNFRINEDTDYGEWWKFSSKDRGQRFDEWSQYANVFDGYTYWSYLADRDQVHLDGGFIRLNTYATDSERRTVVSLHLLAGGPVAVADRHDTIGDNVEIYQNDELLELNRDGFVGDPLTNDPTSARSQIWTGRLSNGDGIVGLFNRESTPQNRSLSFADIGFDGDVGVRDLWQHAELGTMSEISVELPPHGSMVLRLHADPSTCQAQSLTFHEIDDIVYGEPGPVISATAESGLPVEYEVALGSAEVVGDRTEPTTGQSGIVYVVARQPGDGAWCAAIPQVQSFAITGGHEPAMYIAGTFTSWAPKISMRLVDEEWVAEEVRIPAGSHELKFANTEDWTGKDWGNSSGLTGAAAETTGGGPNIRIEVPETSFYRVTFNDLTLAYSLTEVDPGVY